MQRDLRVLFDPLHEIVRHGSGHAIGPQQNMHMRRADNRDAVLPVLD
jgi:hypothetical protein